MSYSASASKLRRKPQSRLGPQGDATRHSVARSRKGLLWLLSLNTAAAALGGHRGRGAKSSRRGCGVRAVPTRYDNELIRSFKSLMNGYIKQRRRCEEVCSLAEAIDWELAWNARNRRCKVRQVPLLSRALDRLTACNECFLFLASKMHELNRHSRIYIAKRMEERRRAVFSKQFAAVREMPSMM